MLLPGRKGKLLRLRVVFLHSYPKSFSYSQKSFDFFICFVKLRTPQPFQPSHSFCVLSNRFSIFPNQSCQFLVRHAISMIAGRWKLFRAVEVRLTPVLSHVL